MTERALRVLVGALGAGAAGYGLALLAATDRADLTGVLLWLGGGVVAHDGLLAPLVLLVGALLSRRLHGNVPAAVPVVGVIIGTVTLVAVPVLGRFGARPDNATLLDRDYVAGWAAFVTAAIGIAVLVGLAARVRDGRRRRRPGS